MLVLTLNNRFVPESEDEAYGFGVVGFSIAIAKELAARGQLAGFVTYARDEALSVPIIRKQSCLGLPGVEFRFNHRINLSALRRAFAAALKTLADQPCRGYHPPLVVYHQSNTLLHLTPPDCPFLVTHHGPFAAEICRRFGTEFANQAFCGGTDKLTQLSVMQARGLEYLRAAPRGGAIELSTVQREALSQEHIPQYKIFNAPPPFDLANNLPALTQNHSAMPGCSIPEAPHLTRSLHIIAATARIDRFKNLEELVSAVNRLALEGLNIQLSMFVGEGDEEPARSALQARLCERMRSRTVLAARLPHAALLRFFEQHRSRGVFVCSSVYETLGITPLEATLAGMTTLVPDRVTTVGITDYISREYRYTPTVEGLVDRLLGLYEMPDLRSIGIRQQKWSTRCVGRDSFFEVLELALTTVPKAKPLASLPG